MALQEAQQAAAEGRRWLEPHLTAGPQSSSPSIPLQQSASARTVEDAEGGGVGAAEGNERYARAAAAKTATVTMRKSSTRPRRRASDGRRVRGRVGGAGIGARLCASGVGREGSLSGDTAAASDRRFIRLFS